MHEEPLPRHVSLGSRHDEPSSERLCERIHQARAHGIRTVHPRSGQLTRSSPAVRRHLDETAVTIDTVTADSADVAAPEAFFSTVWLASVNDAGRNEALAHARRAAADALAAGARVLLLAPGPILVDDGPSRHAGLVDDLKRGRSIDADHVASLIANRAEIEEHGLDRTCRTLYELCREFPDLQFCLMPGSTFYDIPQRHHVELLLSDVGAPNLGYWHDPGRCAALEAQGFDRHESWLEAYKEQMVGITLHDADGVDSGLVPGAGSLDLAMLGDYAAAGTRVTIDARPDWGDEGIRQAVAILQKYGFLTARVR